LVNSRDRLRIGSERVEGPTTSPKAGRRAAHLIPLLGLAGIYLAIIAAGGARAWSGSDAGGKVATVKTMAERHSLVPDVGYWAASADPTGRYHPLVYTARYGSHWVQVTSLPFSELGVLLYRIGGAGLLLALPVLGSLLCAVAARRLALLLGARSGWAAFWLVGLGAPLFYAGDFWEHAAALGLALLAVCLALGDITVASAGLAGLLAGCAAVLRTEMLVYGAVFGVVLLVLPRERRRWLGRPLAIAAAAVGAALPLLTERIAERAVWGRAVSSGRVSALSGAAGTRAGARLHDAALTTFGFFADSSWRGIAVGVCLVFALGAIGWSATRRGASTAREVGLFGAAGVLLLARLKAGAGFVPGLFPAAPVAASGALALWSRGQRPRSPQTKTGSRMTAVTLTALLALPGVWTFAWQGQQLPQWGGRYELVTGVLLTVVGAVAVERAGGWRRPAAAMLAAVSLSVAGLAAVWHVERARDFARAVRLINHVSPDVAIVTTLPHLGREAGAFYGDRRWLAASDANDLPGALTVARNEGVSRVDVVAYGGQPQVPAGWTLVGNRTIPLHGLQLGDYRYVSYGS
jgi:hypothetical protein